MANKWENSIYKVSHNSLTYHGNGAPVWEWQDDILLKPDDSFATRG